MTRVPRPGPPPNPVTAPFWAALAEGRLLLQRCARCGHVQHHPRPLLHLVLGARRRSGSRPPAAGRSGPGRSCTAPATPAWDDADPPYAVVVVELDEGPRLVTAWSGDLDALALGLPVRVGDREEDGHHVLVAAPAPGSRREHPGRAPAPTGRSAHRQLRLVATAQVLAMATWFAATAVAPALREQWSVGTVGATLLISAVQVGFVVGALVSAATNLPDRVHPPLLHGGRLVAAAAAPRRRSRSLPTGFGGRRRAALRSPAWRWRWSTRSG